MPVQIKVMSWNIEKFGDTKLDLVPFSRRQRRTGEPGFSELLAEIIYSAGADIVLIMEVVPGAATQIGNGIKTALNAKQGGIAPNLTWQCIPSNVVRPVILPPLINIAPNARPRFANATVAGQYSNTLATCYDQKQGQSLYWELKATLPTPLVQQQCSDALYTAGINQSKPETYLAFYRCDANQPTAGIWLNSTTKLALDINGCRLAFTNHSGNFLGYQLNDDLIAGRSPFLLPFFTGTGNSATLIPLLLFHVPYEQSYANSMAIRISAIQTMMMIGVNGATVSPNMVAMSQSKNGVICGDFNISYDPSAKNGDSYDSYGFLQQQGYVPRIKLTNTQPPPQFLGWPSTQGQQAFDNVLLKSSSTPTTIQGLIFDPSALWAGKACIGFQYANAQTALKAYWEWISDHMPAVLTVTLP